jgi:2'-5' RNA ligase
MKLCGPPSTDRINSFSLVSYIPGNLGDFITRLRQELVRDCVAQSHVTILPPRPLFIEPKAAEEEIRERVAPFAPFPIRISRIRVFEQTSVVFADIGEGRQSLFEMHSALNTNDFAFDEPFGYHPHITLAQGVPPEQIPQLYETALRRWKESAPGNPFMIDSLTFVQNTVENRWVDLVECELRGEAAVPVL